MGTCVAVATEKLGRVAGDLVEWRGGSGAVVSILFARDDDGAAEVLSMK